MSDLVSVLFSEPKIPQSAEEKRDAERKVERFSALQRAENSSISAPPSPQSAARSVSVLFSEPKIPQCDLMDGLEALQRGFSALQRAENSSMHYAPNDQPRAKPVSVLFSEPKIPQWCARG